MIKFPIFVKVLFLLLAAILGSAYYSSNIHILIKRMRLNLMLRGLFPFLGAILLFLSIGQLQAQPVRPENQAATTEAAFPKAEPTATYTHKVILAETGTFGYEIQQNGRPMIKQTTIPGQPGNKGFATKADAAKVAELMITKLKRGEMPPSVTPEELRKLKVIK